MMRKFITSIKCLRTMLVPILILWIAVGCSYARPLLTPARSLVSIKTGWNKDCTTTDDLSFTPGSDTAPLPPTDVKWSLISRRTDAINETAVFVQWNGQKNQTESSSDDPVRYGISWSSANDSAKSSHKMRDNVVTSESMFRIPSLPNGDNYTVCLWSINNAEKKSDAIGFIVEIPGEYTVIDNEELDWISVVPLSPPDTDRTQLTSWEVWAYRGLLLLLGVCALSIFVLCYVSHKKPKLPPKNHRVMEIISARKQMVTVASRPVSNLIYQNTIDFPSSEGFHLLQPRLMDTDRNAVRKLRELGRGAFGIVSLARLTPSNEDAPLLVAIKECKKLDAQSPDLDSLRREISMLKGLPCHDNVVNMMGYQNAENGVPVMILEYCAGLDLATYLTKLPLKLTDNTGGGKLSSLLEHRLLSIAYQISAGMEHLANNGIIHGDLAARNVLLTRDQTVKITDFGQARRVGGNYTNSSRGKVPIKWLAPELLVSCPGDHVFTLKLDLWSFGIILVELYNFGSVLYKDIIIDTAELPEHLLKLFWKGYRHPKPEFCPDRLYVLMLDCWTMNQGSRPNFRQVAAKIQMMLASLNHQDHRSTIGFSRLGPTTPP